MRRLSRARLFFLELVLDLIFFFLCVAVCLLVFAQAARYDRDGRALDRAVLLAQSTAEAYRAADGDLGTLSHQMGLKQVADDFVLYYNQDWVPVSTATYPGYSLIVAPAPPSDTLSTLSIGVFRCEQEGNDILNTPVYQLHPIHLYTGEVTP